MNKLSMHTPDLTERNFAALAALFPNAVTETVDENGAVVRAIDADVLAQEINTHVTSGKEERYQFTWPDKKKSVLLANAPIAATLRPCREESVNFDTTENLYIEGDNLDVLKLLRETYLNRVKMIYIDPPYNTGNDFIYEDDFAEETGEFLARDGQYDEDGNRMVKNLDSNGRFHTDWLNMIYPRLRVARDLLRDDGIIFISVDDAEVENMKKLCNEIFGEINFVACLVYDKNRKNDAKYFSIGHEYMLAYFKSSATIAERGTIFRANKEGVDEVKTEFQRLRKLYGNDWSKINMGLKQLYLSWSDDARKQLARFTRVDEKGPYRDDGNISWPGGGGPTYDVLHPVTKKPCKVPSRGWVYPNPVRMQEEIESGRVVFGKDESVTPKIRTNLFEQDKQVLRSVFFSYAQTATQEFNKLFGGVRIFENPKNANDIEKLIAYVTNANDGDIVLDFFSGSATTAHAVMQLNAGDGGRRKFIMVQLPEVTDENSEAFKAGYKNICEIGKERIRRVGAKIKADNAERDDIENLDIGFRVLKLDSSNMKDVYYTPQDTVGANGEFQLSIDGFIENIKEDRTPEDLLFQVMLDLGIPLSGKIERREFHGTTVFLVNSPGENYLAACFERVDDRVVTEIARSKPYYAVFRDSSFASDSTLVNFEQIFKTYSPTTVRRVL
jgi:adenine-specific DNA-methyltransferase